MTQEWNPAVPVTITEAPAHKESYRAKKRIAELEAAIREMIMSVPGGSICDPQDVADALRQIAERHRVPVDEVQF